MELHVDKATLKKITAEKKKAGKISRAAASKKNAAAMKKAGKGILDADFKGITWNHNIFRLLIYNFQMVKSSPKITRST